MKIEPKPVAIITGAAGGIGTATVETLSSLGYRCCLVGRSMDPLAALQSRIPESYFCAADVTQPIDVEHIISRTLEHFGQIDALINNAGHVQMHSLEETTPKIWNDVIAANLTSAYLMCRAAWPIFRRQRRGVIVNISSFSARDPFPGLIAYGAAKAGVNNLGISLAKEGREFGARVYTVAPGAVETPMLRRLFSPDQLPPEAALQPAEIARVIGECVIGTTSAGSGEVIWIGKGSADLIDGH